MGTKGCDCSCLVFMFIVFTLAGFASVFCVGGFGIYFCCYDIPGIWCTSAHFVYKHALRAAHTAPGMQNSHSAHSALAVTAPDCSTGAGTFWRKILRLCVCRWGNLRLVGRCRFPAGPNDCACVEWRCHNDPLTEGYRSPWAQVFARSSIADADRAPSVGISEPLLEEYADGVVASYAQDARAVAEENAGADELYRQWAASQPAAQRRRRAAATDTPVRAATPAAMLGSTRAQSAAVAVAAALDHVSSAHTTPASSPLSPPPTNIFDLPANTERRSSASALGLFGDEPLHPAGALSGSAGLPSAGLPARSARPPQRRYWFFVDGEGEVQGDFKAAKMRAWRSAGFFFPDTRGALPLCPAGIPCESCSQCDSLP